MNLQEIADANNLNYIETTNQSNGYPSGIKGAIIGFEKFEEAEKLANEFDLSIEFFKRKDGWGLWYRSGNVAHEEMNNSCEDFGENYSQFEKITEEEFINQEITPFIKELIEENTNFDFIESFIKQQKELFEKIDELEENEIVITCQSEYYDTIKTKSMSFYYDTKHLTIGLINRN